MSITAMIFFHLIYVCFSLCFDSFDPPGVMSAGLTCDFVVTFKPMVSLKEPRHDILSCLFESLKIVLSWKETFK